ncbi:hypothetical protein OAA15_00150 [bacterium]|nr:hypothetical protein [bacterium]
MANLGPQIVQNSFGGLLKFETAGNTGITTGKLRITDGSGKETPLFLATSSVHIESEFTASSDVVLSGLSTTAQGHYVSIDSTTGRLHYSATSSIQNVVSSSYSLTASYAMNAEDGDWTIGSSFMTASGTDSIYVPNKVQMGLNTEATGDKSHAQGHVTRATGNFSHAEGLGAWAEGFWSHAEGYNTTASGNYAHAEGQKTKAIGTAAHAEGLLTYASNEAHAEGYNTTASFNFAHSEGQNTQASAYASHAEGASTWARGEYSHAEGVNTEARGMWSHAAGDTTTALGAGSHVNGYQTTAVRDYQTVVGKHNIKTYSHDDVFVVGTGDNIESRDGFKVRAPYGQAILNQTQTFLLPIFGDGLSDDSPGLNFGEPVTNGNVRIVSTNNITYGGGALYIQEHNGTNYNNMVMVSSDAIFVPA